jgi:hypothetical protein
VLAATPAPLVAVKPTHELRTLAPVNDVAVDAGRAATLVGIVHAWEYLLVWTPRRIVVRASLACDTQESNLVLAGNRFAHVCFQGESFVVTGTLRPLRAHVVLRAPVSRSVTLAASGSLVAGSIGRTVWRFDAGAKTKLRDYPKPVIVLGVDRDRILVDRGGTTLDVLTRTGKVRETVRLAHDGGALLRGGRLAAITKRRLVVADLDGRTLASRPVEAGARLEDFAGPLVVYSAGTRLHLLRLRDGRDLRLRLRGQFGYAHARLADGALFYAYTRANGMGRAGYVSAAAVRGLFSR